MELRLNRKLAEKYQGRYAYMYAMYPNNNFWSTQIGEEHYKDALRALPAYKPSAPTLLYVHYPYCTKICHFCSCYKLRTGNYERARNHLNHTLKEMEMTADFLESEAIDPGFRLIHLGGGSPTYLENEDLNRLVAHLRRLANFDKVEEFAMEIDPRHADPERMLYFRSLGVSRISFGIQDFDPDVQEAVNRPQPPEMVQRLLTPDIRKNFQSVSFDILHGLPKQNLEKFKKTMDIVLDLNPDRVVLLTYNHSPHIVRNQRAIEDEFLPTKPEKEEMFAVAAEMLLANGFVRIGLEHFAKPKDKLNQLWESGDFNWNMSGYGWGDANKIVGFGPHAVSRITDDYYFQKIIAIPEYDAAIDAGKYPIARGHKLSLDEKIRREVTIRLRSRLKLNYAEIEQRFGINFKEYFASELSQLPEHINDGVIEVNDQGITATHDGAPFIAFVCMLFDKFTEPKVH